MSFDFFGEGIAASKGRAIDLSLSGRYSFTKNLQGNIGYRLLEGGANGTYRYNFIQLHFIFCRKTENFFVLLPVLASSWFNPHHK